MEFNGDEYTLETPENIDSISPGAGVSYIQQQTLRRKMIRGIKRGLAPYPSLYEFVAMIYQQIGRRFRHMSEKISVPLGTSRQHISCKKGLVQITTSKKDDLLAPLSPYTAHYEEKQDYSGHKTEIKAIAYHLPQFHQIPENNEWWGEGFTEWHNTRKAKPLFPGHYQPREPHSDIGYYDLGEISALKRQVDMAKRHGIYGFCFYHYWFHGKRLLGKPVDLLLNTPEINMPFCLCWANETWSKKWDGKDHHILIQQKFSPEDDLRFIKFLAPYFRDSRYIRINGKPLLMVYRVSKLPKPLETVNRWRKWCLQNGIGEIHLVSVCHGEVYPHTPLDEIGFDAYAAFPPHSFPCQHISADSGIFKGGYRFDYATGVAAYTPNGHGTRIYEGCTLGWDNTPRFKRVNVTMYLNFSLEKYYSWLRKIVDYTRATFPVEERLLFINAWNEWAEGAYLEPDKRYGYAYLNTTAKALFGLPFNDNGYDKRLDKDSSFKYAQDYKWLKREIENQSEHSLAVINQFINSNSEVLEFGPASGHFTRYLKEERGAVVDIVEIDKHCAEVSARYARTCHIGNIEHYAWKDAFSQQSYDYVLFADVLEHLQDPWRVLKESAYMLKPGGKTIISVPNIAHAQILASLYNNDFSYASVGIMDRTHLRFFTEPTFREMIREAGLKICKMVPVEAPVLPVGCGTRWNKTKVPGKLREFLKNKEHAHAIQFVACCEK